MASVIKTGSWNGNLGGNTYWGLSRQVGPWKSTPIDEVRAASRPGYPYANAATAFSASSIHPYIQTLPPVKLGFNVSDIYIEPDYSTPPNAVLKKSPMGPGVNGGKYVMDTSTGFWKRIHGKSFGKDKDERGINRAPDVIPTVIKKTGVNLADKVAATSATNTGKKDRNPGLKINTDLFEMNALLGSPITPSVVGSRTSGSISSAYTKMLRGLYSKPDVSMASASSLHSARDVSMASSSTASSTGIPMAAHLQRPRNTAVGKKRRGSETLSPSYREKASKLMNPKISVGRPVTRADRIAALKSKTKKKSPNLMEID